MDVIQMRRTSLVSLALVMDVIQMRRTSLVSLCIHMATQRTTMSPVNMGTTGG